MKPNAGTDDAMEFTSDVKKDNDSISTINHKAPTPRKPSGSSLRQMLFDKGEEA